MCFYVSFSETIDTWVVVCIKCIHVYMYIRMCMFVCGYV